MSRHRWDDSLKNDLRERDHKDVNGFNWFSPMAGINIYDGNFSLK